MDGEPDRDLGGDQQLDELVELLQRLVVATKEGGAISGEERLREHTDQLYGAINSWESQPSVYQLSRIKVLQGQLADIARRFDTLVKGELAGVNSALTAEKLAPIPVPPPAPAGAPTAGGDQVKALDGWRFGVHSSIVGVQIAAERD